MAKGKSANPADAHRKALRKKELKKNKAGRSKARDFALVKKDTWELEDNIEKLKGSSELSPSDKARLKELKDELEKVNKKKEEYIAEHPEHRKLVFRSRKQQHDTEKEDDSKPELKSRRIFDKHGLPRHPERSIYYDPVMNPYGVPPPGMPYIERPLRPDEVDSDPEDIVADSDDDVALPAGPPPVQSEESQDSDDDIPMPEGPPPLKDGAPFPSPLPLVQYANAPPLPPFPHPPLGFNPPLPPPLPMIPGPPPFHNPNFHGLPPNVLLPPGFPMPPPPPPPNFPGHVPSGSYMPNTLPPPPPGFFPRRGQSAAASQDPLSSIPHQTYQAHRALRANESPHHSLLPKPSSSSHVAGNVAISSAATVSAAPELRDLKKESTAFVPSALKRKKAAVGASSSSSSKVNAAPSVGQNDESDIVEPPPRPDLLGALKDQFGPAATTKQESSHKKAKRNDDYAKFMDEMGDILGPTS